MSNEVIIAYRIKDGRLNIVLDEGGDGDFFPFVFQNRDVALDYIGSSKLFESGQAYYQLIEVDEL